MRGLRWLIPLALVAACDSDGTAVPAPEVPQYLSVDTRLLDDRIVNFFARSTSAEGAQDYARCAAAQYALIRGYFYARPVRATVTEEGGIWTVDAVYTISPELPPGVDVVDAEITVVTCQAQDIPTV